jgi:hypothetical protein
MPGMTSAAIGVVILMIGKRTRRIY